MALNSDLFNRICMESIEAYHVSDDVKAECYNPYAKDSIEWLTYQKNWIDTVQWHLEDLIRVKDIDPERALAIKREIDASNQRRTDIVEEIDDYLFAKFSHVNPQPDARTSTETPAWAIDRLSILNLKLYHFKEELERKDADEDHLRKCKLKADVLLDQHRDLTHALDELIKDLASGAYIMKVYKQMKMYNDEELNPMLRKSSTSP